MTTNTYASRPLSWGLLMGTALLAILFLYFIDEGRYSLEGLFTGGNAIALGIYLTGMLFGLFLMTHLFAKRPPGKLRTALVLTLGTAAGFIFGLLLVMGAGLVQSMI
ncbi:MAG: hypothetical protein ACOH13_14615 [Flavobacteriales bacterium]